MQPRTRRFGLTLALCFALVGTGLSRADDKVKDIVGTAQAAGSFKTLTTALTKANLVSALQRKGPFTVLAPTDEAFAKLPAGTVKMLLQPKNRDALVGILTYHVAVGELESKKLVGRSAIKTLNGQQVKLKFSNGKLSTNQATVVKADIHCSNGVIHVIDQVLLPSSEDLIQTAVKAGNFKTLATAIKAAGLVEALKSKGPFTVFAPTDSAFAKLPKKTIATLLKPENKGKLVGILKYHVVAGRNYASDLKSGQHLKTLEGSTIRFNVHGKTARVNKSTIVATDVNASNGVIHVIDSVLLPPEKQARRDLKKMIVNAINRGAPMYNAGHVHRCMTLYMSTAQDLLRDGDRMSSKVQTRLKHAVRAARNSHMSAQSRAWILRHALDDAYRFMQTIEN